MPAGPRSTAGTPFALNGWMRSQNPLLLWSLSAGATAAYVVVANRVAAQRTSRLDESARNTLQQSRRPSGELAASATNPLGKEWLHIPAAVALSAYLGRRGIGRAAVLPAVASVIAEIASRALDHLPPHRHPPAGHPKPHKPSFPSGHALETTAVAATSAYILAREDVTSAPTAFTIALALALASTFGRLYRDRHWASDAVAGGSMGLAIAATCAALYEGSARN